MVDADDERLFSALVQEYTELLYIGPTNNFTIAGARNLWKERLYFHELSRGVTPYPRTPAIHAWFEAAHMALAQGDMWDPDGIGFVPSDNFYHALWAWQWVEMQKLIRWPPFLRRFVFRHHEDWTLAIRIQIIHDELSFHLGAANEPLETEMPVPPVLNAEWTTMSGNTSALIDAAVFTWDASPYRTRLRHACERERMDVNRFSAWTHGEAMWGLMQHQRAEQRVESRRWLATLIERWQAAGIV